MRYGAVSSNNVHLVSFCQLCFSFVSLVSDTKSVQGRSSIVDTFELNRGMELCYSDTNCCFQIVSRACDLPWFTQVRHKHPGVNGGRRLYDCVPEWRHTAQEITRIFMDEKVLSDDWSKVLFTLFATKNANNMLFRFLHDWDYFMCVLCLFQFFDSHLFPQAEEKP